VKKKKKNTCPPAIGRHAEDNKRRIDVDVFKRVVSERPYTKARDLALDKHETLDCQHFFVALDIYLLS